ncbi:MAG: prolyl oligopeptidase family serine peptidase [Pseudomonadota bacterium]|nr:MAG: prolyl oligopeptidase family serine peptidase [Pseudomonadota bacterium]
MSPVEVETAPNPRATVIWLHGLGADGHDFEPVVPQLALSGTWRFVFPHAPYRPVTINGGYTMRAWYDLGSGPSGLWQNAEHIEQSARTVAALVELENARGTASEHIVLAGFSQGGVVALMTGLRFPERLAGIIALSAPLMAADRLARSVSAANASTPVFLGHGLHDARVPIAIGEQAHQKLSGQGIPAEWHVYPMDHSVCLEELADISAWLGRILPLK